MTLMSRGGIAGFAVTGRSPAGSCRAFPVRMARRRRIRCRCFLYGRSQNNLRRSLFPAALISLLLPKLAATLASMGMDLGDSGSYFRTGSCDLSLRLFSRNQKMRGQGSIWPNRSAPWDSTWPSSYLHLPAYRTEAFYSLDAILRAHWRMLFSHRHLLEWSASSEHKHKGRDDLGESFRSMWAAPAVALVAP